MIYGGSVRRHRFLSGTIIIIMITIVMLIYHVYGAQLKDLTVPLSWRL